MGIEYLLTQSPLNGEEVRGESNSSLVPVPHVVNQILVDTKRFGPYKTHGTSKHYTWTWPVLDIYKS